MISKTAAVLVIPSSFIGCLVFAGIVTFGITGEQAHPSLFEVICSLFSVGLFSLGTTLSIIELVRK